MTDERPLLILDIDETLVHASLVRFAHKPDFVIDDYFVYKRPGLHAFLEAVATAFQLAFWSSGTDLYVQLVLHQILPEGISPKFVWSRERCTERFDSESNDFVYRKDLKKVSRQGYKLQQILVVEDKRQNIDRHRGNVVTVTQWTGDPDDTELSLLTHYLLKIQTAENFRDLHKQNWRTEV